jgi:hypothetical protein
MWKGRGDIGRERKGDEYKGSDRERREEERERCGGYKIHGLRIPVNGLGVR